MIDDSERKTAYNASVSFIRYLGEYMKKIADKHGVQEAFEVQKQMCIQMGKQSAEAIRQSPSREEFTLNFASDYYVDGSRSVGIDASSEIRGDKVHIVMRECPIYDGLKAAGFTDDMVERFCVNNTVYRTRLALEGYSDDALFEIIKFRDKRDNPCLKQVTINK